MNDTPADEIWRMSGGRRVPRPQQVLPCPQCGAPLGHHYPDCPPCYHAIEDIYLADWRALLEREGVKEGTAEETLLAEVVMAETERHPWTAVNIAMTLLTCQECGQELGSRYQECAACAIAFGSALASEFGATFNDHALHVGRWVLRHRHQHSTNAVTAWSLTVPRVLTGWLPSRKDAQRMMAAIKDGRVDDVQAELQKLDGEINGGPDKDAG